MNFVPVMLEEVAAKYCKPGERIVHEYFIENARTADGNIGAYRRSLYTYEPSLNGEGFSCEKFSTLEEALNWKKEFDQHFPNNVIEIRELSDEDIHNLSLDGLKRSY